MSYVGGMMPIERPREMQQRSLSAHNSPVTTPIHSPVGSRRGSLSSIGSVQTDSGLDHYRHSSLASIDSNVSTKSGFRSLFHKKEKKPKDQKSHEKIILTSKHAAAVKTKLMMQQHENSKNNVKTAGVVGTIHSGHLTAAAQEARHPHSGPPALHPATQDMPILTRIISADEPDSEDEYERNERQRQEWESSKKSGLFARVTEHESDESAHTSANASADEGELHSHANSTSTSTSTSPQETSLRPPKLQRPMYSPRNSFGGRFKKDDQGNWKR